MPGDRVPASLPLDVPLRQSWEIRRRRHADSRVLVRHNEVYQLSDMADAVWCETVGGRTFIDVIAAVANDCAGADRQSIVRAATTALEDLIAMGFVVIGDAT